MACDLITFRDVSYIPRISFVSDHHVAVQKTWLGGLFEV